jgi:hypothetical protein
MLCVRAEKTISRNMPGSWCGGGLEGPKTSKKAFYLIDSCVAQIRDFYHTHTQNTITQLTQLTFLGKSENVPTYTILVLH